MCILFEERGLLSFFLIWEFFTWVIVQQNWTPTSTGIDFISKHLSRDDIKKKKITLGNDLE